jgi:hypothetical protein
LKSSGCLASGTIPYDATNIFASIANSAFAGCAGITSVNIGPVTNIGMNAFGGCINLISVIGTGVLAELAIGDYAFYGCANLQVLTFGG